MEKKIIVNQLNKMINNLITYKDNSQEVNESLTPIDFEMLKQQIENQEFVITVVGAMKSGKSSFTNALLGHDLMPNENQACTLTSTDIVHHEHDNKITKSFDDGKKEILESENLSYVFHEDVRKSRTEEQKEFYTYQVNYPIYSLKKYPILHDTKFILMDTPGLNEMEGLGVKKETIEEVFSHALRRTDLLLFVLDVQYYKSEENLQIIETIRRQRPDLLESIVFVLNKVDKLRDRDGSSETLMGKVKELLQSWGVKTNQLFPVSARKALLGRLIEQGVDTVNLKDEISSFLPTKTIEFEGQTLTVQIPITSASSHLIEESGVLQLEQQILENTYLQVDRKLHQSILDRLQEITNKIDENILKGKSKIKIRLEEMKKDLHAMQQRLRIIEELGAGERKSRVGLEWILRDINLKSKAMEKKLPYSVNLSMTSNGKSAYQYSSSSEARQVGISNFDEWFHRNTEPLYQKVLSHYQNLLEFKPNGDNFYHSISELVTKALKNANSVISTASRQLPDIQIRKLIDEIQIRPQGLSNIPNVDWKYKEFIKKIFTDSKTTQWEESFLIFFSQTRSRTDYLYNISGAFSKAEKHIQETLKNISKDWHEETIQKRYTDTYKSIEEMVLKPLNQIHDKVETLLQDTKSDIFLLESKIALLQSEILELENLKNQLGFRTDLITKRKCVTVDSNTINLDTIISKVEDGTTIFLQEGTFQLKQKNKLNKTIALIGLGRNLTNVKLEKGAGITVQGKHGFQLDGINFQSSHTTNFFEVDALELFIENCQFSSISSGSALLVKGNTEGIIRKSHFSGFEKGVTLQNNSRIEVSSNYFTNNHSALEIREEAEQYVINNSFINNNIGAKLADNTQGSIEGNSWTDNVQGIQVSGNSTPCFFKNHFTRNKECGISLKLDSNANIEDNTFKENGSGVSCTDASKAVISRNIFINNTGEGLIIAGNGTVEVYDNEFKKNNKGLVIISQANALISRNHILESQVHGILCSQHGALKASMNKIESNIENGVLCEGNSRVELRDNVISSNRNGVQLEGNSTFVLVGNRCLDNTESGIKIQEEASGRANQNQCNNNHNGLFLSGQCRISLVENESSNNADNGIVCDGNMSGRILKNLCHGNGSFALKVKKTIVMNHKYNEGKGLQERPSTLSYWVNSWRKLSSNLLAKLKKKEIINHEY